MTLPPSLSSFWCQIIPAGADVFLEAPIDKVITLTNAVIPDVTSETPKETVRLYATVNTLNIDSEDEGEEENEKSLEEDKDYIVDEVLVASLTPFTKENQQLSIVFTAANIVKFHNKGKLDVHLSGFIVDYDDDNYEGYEYDYEEEEKNEAPAENEAEAENPDAPVTVDTFQNRIAKAAKSMGPRQINFRNKKKNKHKKRSNKDGDGEEEAHEEQQE